MRFGSLAVLEEAGRRQRQVTWKCKCDCGNIIEVKGCHLRRGRSKSCGCPKRKHGKAYTRAYTCWGSMKKRCENTNSVDYFKYGARGIKVCQRWQKFENFYEDMGDPPNGYSIERIDNDKGYFPENCKWATMKEQSQNRRTPQQVKEDAERLVPVF